MKGGVIQAMTNKDLFAQWLSENVVSSYLSEYIMSFSEVEAYARNKNLINGSIYDFSDPIITSKIVAAISSDRIFRVTHKNKMRRIKEVALLFCRYIKEKQKSIKYKPSTFVIKEEINTQNIRRSKACIRREAFKNWLWTQFKNPDTIQTTSWAVSKVSEFAEKYQLVSGSLFSVEDTDQLAAIWGQLNTISEFIVFRKKNDVLSFAFNKYLQYRGGELAVSTRSEVQPVIAVSHYEIKDSRVDFEAWLKESGTPAGSIQTYSASVKRIGDALLENGTEYRHLYSIFGISRLEQIRETLEQNQNAATAIGNATLQDLDGFRKYIQFRKKESSQGLDDITHNRYTTILKKNFENGFRLGSLIDRNRFKLFYRDVYGEEIAKDDDTILELIKKVGEFQGDRIFVRNGRSSSDLLDDIQEDIAKTFKKGASCVFLSSVFEKYRQALASGLQIYAEDVLREQLLATNYGAYSYSGAKKYFFKGISPDVSKDVKELMKQSQLPMSYNQIHEILWYIPIETIKQALKTDDIVSAGQGTFFYVGNLPISTSELEYIAELIDAQLSQKTFITDADLRELIHQNCPSTYINTESFSTLGLRNALAARLKDRFSFNGAIISKRGQEINMAQVFEAFCDTHDKISLDELLNFAKEINSTTVYWEKVYSKMVRISQTEFVKRSSMNFNVQRIDAVLNQLIEHDYVPLRGFSLFFHLPSISVKWNEYVLEGYVALYSQEFTLLHLCYTETDCCGAIVRKSSHIQDFKTLVTEVLAKSDEWKTQSDALALLVKNGYLQRKRYSEIDSVITDARLLKESKRNME